MKKIIFIIGFALVSLSAMTQEKKAVWDFPVNAQSKEWENLKSVEEQFGAYNIPVEMIKKISTEELVKTCLSYPEWGLIHAYNDRITGLSVIISLFNGFQELFSRDDAALELMKEYVKIDPLAVGADWTPLQQGQYSFRMTQIELLLSRKSIVNKLDETDIRKLKEAAVLKYKQKKMLQGIYSLWDLSPTAGICLTILLEKDGANSTGGKSEMQNFKRNLMTEDIGILDEIVELTEKSKL
jgi:hypothetical protein